MPIPQEMLVQSSHLLIKLQHLQELLPVVSPNAVGEVAAQRDQAEASLIAYVKCLASANHCDVDDILTHIWNITYGA